MSKLVTTRITSQPRAVASRHNSYCNGIEVRICFCCFPFLASSPLPTNPTYLSETNSVLSNLLQRMPLLFLNFASDAYINTTRVCLLVLMLFLLSLFPEECIEVSPSGKLAPGSRMDELQKELRSIIVRDELWPSKKVVKHPASNNLIDPAQLTLDQPNIAQGPSIPT